VLLREILPALGFDLCRADGFEIFRQGCDGPSGQGIRNTGSIYRHYRLQHNVPRLLGRPGHLPAWNFSKYVVGQDGRVVAFFPSEVTPGSPELRTAIEKALAAPPR